MIGFKQYLNEAFDKSLPFASTMKSPRGAVYTFTYPKVKNGLGHDIKYTVTISRIDEGSRYVYDLDFSNNISSTRPLFSKKVKPMPVYSTIGAIIKDFVKRYPMEFRDRFKFTSSHDAQIPIYTRFISKIAKELGGHEVESKSYNSFEIIKGMKE